MNVPGKVQEEVDELRNKLGEPYTKTGRASLMLGVDLLWRYLWSKFQAPPNWIQEETDALAKFLDDYEARRFPMIQDYEPPGVFKAGWEACRAATIKELERVYFLRNTDSLQLEASFRAQIDELKKDAEDARDALAEPAGLIEFLDEDWLPDSRAAKMQQAAQNIVRNSWMIYDRLIRKYPTKAQLEIQAALKNMKGYRVVEGNNEIQS